MKYKYHHHHHEQAEHSQGNCVFAFSILFTRGSEHTMFFPMFLKSSGSFSFHMVIFHLFLYFVISHVLIPYSFKAVDLLYFLLYSFQKCYSFLWWRLSPPHILPMVWLSSYRFIFRLFTSIKYFYSHWIPLVRYPLSFLLPTRTFKYIKYFMYILCPMYTLLIVSSYFC